RHAGGIALPRHLSLAAALHGLRHRAVRGRAHAAAALLGGEPLVDPSRERQGAERDHPVPRREVSRPRGRPPRFTDTRGRRTPYTGRSVTACPRRAGSVRPGGGGQARSRAVLAAALGTIALLGCSDGPRGETRITT